MDLLFSAMGLTNGLVILSNGPYEWTCNSQQWAYELTCYSQQWALRMDL